jgi:ABC-type multidrug transport system ATPase subunit
MQDDVFMGTLTVREYLGYIAQLRLPSEMPDEQKMQKVIKPLFLSHSWHIY